MYVVFISPHSDPEAIPGEPDSGGQCIYEYQLADALSRLPDTRVSIMCRQTFQRPDITQVNHGFSIRRIQCGPNHFVPKEEIEPLLPEFADTALRVFEKDPPTLLHAHYWDGGKASLLIKTKQRSLPLIWTPHSLGSLKRRKFPGQDQENKYNFIPRLCWENYTSFVSEQVITSTLEEKQDVIRDYCLDQEKIKIISPGIKVADFNLKNQTSMRKKYRLPTKGTMLLSLGRMTPAKGYHHAIELLSELKKIHAEPVFLVICGGSQTRLSPEEKTYISVLQRLIKILDVQVSFFFRPAVPHDKIHEIYSASDVVLMLSEHEPFGLVVIEAMVMKKPVVAANAGGPSSIITHNQTGVLINTHSLERGAYYVRSLIKDKALVKKITSNAYAYATSTFDWNIKAREFRSVYEMATKTRNTIFSAWLKTNYFFQHNLFHKNAILH